jgi:hypothetical protein
MPRSAPSLRCVLFVTSFASAFVFGCAAADDSTSSGGNGDEGGTTSPPTSDAGSGSDTSSPTTSPPSGDSGGVGAKPSGAIDSGSGGSDASSGGGLHFERVYGNGTSLMGSWGAGVTLGVRVVDGSGAPVAGVPIEWSNRGIKDFAYFPAAGGATTLTWPTDADGWSSPDINAPNPEIAVTESVLTAKIASGGSDARDFFVETTNNGDSLGPAGQEAFADPLTPPHSSLGPYKVGDVIPSALTFDVVCSNATHCPGTPLQNVSVRINLPDPTTPYSKSDPKLDAPVECVGVEPLTDGKGVVHCDLHVKRAYTGPIRFAVGQFVEFEYSITAE